MPRLQPFVAVVALLQLLGGIYSAWKGDWKMATVNIALGVANAVFSSMR